MQFPLATHKNAFNASEAGLCAQDQGKFWEMHDKLFANQQALKQEDLIKYANALGLDKTKFKQCLDIGKYTEEIIKDKAIGRKVGITGTPHFLLGYTRAMAQEYWL